MRLVFDTYFVDHLCVKKFKVNVLSYVCPRNSG
jgi:hypothetical protein